MKIEKLVGDRFKERPSDCVIDSHALMGSVKSYMKTGKSNTLTGKNSNGGKRYRG